MSIAWSVLMVSRRAPDTERQGNRAYPLPEHDGIERSHAERVAPAPGADMEGFVRELMAFVDFGAADVEMIRRTAPLVLKHEHALTSALYEHFLQFPATARFFSRLTAPPIPSAWSDASIVWPAGCARRLRRR